MKPYTRIEYPACGESYERREYGVYEYDEYPRSSVLAGMPRRVYLGSYPTEAEARAAHPNAEKGVHNCGWREVNLDHLPGEDDPVPGGMYPDDYEARDDDWGSDMDQYAKGGK